MHVEIVFVTLHLPASRYFTRDEGPPGTSIFVRNLPESVTTEKLAEVFGVFGALRGAAPVSLRKQKDKDTFAFVDFQEPAAQQAAIAGAATLDGQQVRAASSMLLCVPLPACWACELKGIRCAHCNCELHLPPRTRHFSACLLSSIHSVGAPRCFVASCESLCWCARSSVKIEFQHLQGHLMKSMYAHAAASGGEEAALHQEQGPRGPTPRARHVPRRPHGRPRLRPRCPRRRPRWRPGALSGAGCLPQQVRCSAGILTS